MLRYQDIAHNTARVRALTTLEPDEFADLVPVFETCFMERVRDYTIDGLPRLNRCYTPYTNSALPTIEDKLLFILVHMKQNLTQEVQGQLFGMVQSDANKWLQLLRPVLGTQEQLRIPASWHRTDDVNEPFAENGQALKLGFDLIHRFLGQRDPGLVDGGHELDHRMVPLPGHARRELKHRLKRIEQGPIPMVLQDPPAAFHRVVLTVIRWVIRQADRQAVLLRKRQQPQHELRASTVVLRAVVEIEHQGRDVRKARPHLLPPLGEPIHQAVTGHFGGHCVQKQLIQLRQEDAHWRHRRRGLKSMVRRLDRDPTRAPTRERSDLDGRFGIH